MQPSTSFVGNVRLGTNFELLVQTKITKIEYKSQEMSKQWGRIRMGIPWIVLGIILKSLSLAYIEHFFVKWPR